MGTAKQIRRIGGLAVALGVGSVRHAATRMTVSIGAAVLVVTATVVPTPIPTVSPEAVRLSTSTDSTALILGGTTVPTPDNAYIETVRNHFIAPTHPGQAINDVAVTTPEEGWPITGLIRLLGLALGPQSVWGPGGPGWPDEPWWKLSGLFDLTYDQSTRAGVADLEQAMAEHGNDHLVIYGYSQGAMIAIREKRKLAEQYPVGTKAPDIDFVLSGDLNLPNGGLLARFPGLYIPILDISFNGPEPTATPFDTAVITRQYDGLADFPLYPLNVISLLNAVLGAVYVHLYDLDVSLAPDPGKSPSSRSEHGDTDYYFFENPDLPLFGPLRTLGVPESVIDVVEPFFRVLVELGYDRSIPPWEPTPARLIPMHDPVTVAADLLEAIGEGINNALALVGLPTLQSTPVPVTLAASGTQTAKADISPLVTSIETLTQTEQVTTKVTEAANADVSRQVTPTATVAETGQVSSAKKVAETAKADVTPAGPTAATAPKASADAKPATVAKPVGRPAAPRPVVRGSFGAGQQLRDLAHRGNGGHPTTRKPAAGDGPATARRSSVASSPAASTRGNFSGGNASEGDADDS